MNIRRPSVKDHRARTTLFVALTVADVSGATEAPPVKAPPADV